jgi:hypothetical protein
MKNNYTEIIFNNLKRLFLNLPQNLSQSIPAMQEGNTFIFTAFGAECVIQPEGITLEGEFQTGPVGILISLYALHAKPEPGLLEPLRAFQEFPGSMPYTGAFASHTENILIPHVEQIHDRLGIMLEKLEGRDAAGLVKGDFSFLIKPFPKITLCYRFYTADEEFPPSVNCLFSNNALSFLPLAALADTAEFTSLKIMKFLD